MSLPNLSKKASSISLVPVSSAFHSGCTFFFLVVHILPRASSYCDTAPSLSVCEEVLQLVPLCVCVVWPFGPTFRRLQHGGKLKEASGITVVTLLAADPGSDPSLLTEPDCPAPQQPATGGQQSAHHRALSVSPGAPPACTAGHTEQVCATLHLVDLAGSECVGE